MPKEIVIKQKDEADTIFVIKHDYGGIEIQQGIGSEYEQILPDLESIPALISALTELSKEK